MKIKNSNEKLSSAKLILPFITILIICVLIRGYQIFSLIDSKTGFYDKSSITIAILYILIFASCIAFCVISYISKDSIEFNTDALKSKSAGAVSLITGIAMLLDGFTSFFSGLSAASSAGYSDAGAFKELMSGGSFASTLRGIFAVLSAVYFCMLFSSFKKGDNSVSKHKILALSPVAWAAFRMFGLFVKKISFLRVSDLFFELVMLAFAAIFLMGFAQVTSGVYSDGSAWKIPAFGTCAALISGMLSITRLIFTVIDSNRFINAEYPFCVTDFTLFLFALIIIVKLSKNIRKKPVSDNIQTQQDK